MSSGFNRSSRLAFAFLVAAAGSACADAPADRFTRSTAAATERFGDDGRLAVSLGGGVDAD